MKVVARLVEVIGDNAWVDQTIERSIDGVLVVLPGRRLVRSVILGTMEIQDDELAIVEAKAGPQPSPRPSAAAIPGEDSP